MNKALCACTYREAETKANDVQKEQGSAELPEASRKDQAAASLGREEDPALSDKESSQSSVIEISSDSEGDDCMIQTGLREGQQTR